MSFFGSFFGSDQKKDLVRANAQATGAINQGLEAGRAGYEAGRSRFDPYETGGRAGYNALLGALGLNGTGAQTEFLDRYREDPTQQYMQQAVARQFAARGLSDSGASRLASARVWNEGYNTHLNRLTGIGQQGQQAAGNQAQFDQGIGDLEFGTGQLRANQAINFGNALAANRSTGINNLLGVAGLGVKALGGMYGGK